jgi:TPP-dependent trihydroxycyclohexane-1,2-dione (THcHDO) dehydratase
MKNMNKKNDYILMLAALLLLILSASAIFWFSGNRRDNDISQSAPKILGKATLTTDFGNGSERIFEGDIVEGETLLDALNQASKAGNFSYQLDEKNNLAAIDSFIRNKNKSWHWYLNDKKIDKLLGEIILKSGDEILLQYK